MNKEVIIRFKNIGNKYHWHVNCGNYQMAGYGDNLEDAENHAYSYVKGITNHGTIHCIYPDGKKPQPRK